jgi:hypothetical protein
VDNEASLYGPKFATSCYNFSGVPETLFLLLSTNYTFPVVAVDFYSQTVVSFIGHAEITREQGPELEFPFVDGISSCSVNSSYSTSLVLSVGWFETSIPVVIAEFCEPGYDKVSPII